MQSVPPAGLAKVHSPELREFIELCIQHDPDKRPEARQLLKSPFFDSIRTGKMSCPGLMDSLGRSGAFGAAASTTGER